MRQLNTKPQGRAAKAPPAPSPVFLLSARQSAAALCVSLPTFYRAVARGDVCKPGKIGARSVWTVDSIRLAAERIGEPAAAAA